MSSMRRPGQFADTSMNAQMHRMQHPSGTNHFSGRAESLNREEEYLASKTEGQWEWDRDGQMGTSLPSSHGYREIADLYRGQRSESKVNSDKKGNIEREPRAREQEIEHGYEDGSFFQTWEGLERKFFDDIMKLTKEHDSAEDAENSRHRERLNEINVQFEEKLSSVRAQQAAIRDDFLQREQQIRQQQYQQQAVMSSYAQGANAAAAAAAFGPAAAAAAATAAAALGEVPQGYGRGQFGSYRERQQFVGSGGGTSGGGGGGGGGGRGRGFQGGRGYGSNARYY